MRWCYTGYGTEDGTHRSGRKTPKIVDALRKLNEAGGTELADFLGYSKSAACVHLATLGREGFVVADDGTHRLGCGS